MDLETVDLEIAGSEYAIHVEHFVPPGNVPRGEPPETGELAIGPISLVKDPDTGRCEILLFVQVVAAWAKAKGVPIDDAQRAIELLVFEELMDRLDQEGPE